MRRPVTAQKCYRSHPVRGTSNKCPRNEDNQCMRIDDTILDPIRLRVIGRIGPDRGTIETKVNRTTAAVSALLFALSSGGVLPQFVIGGRALDQVSNRFTHPSGRLLRFARDDGICCGHCEERSDEAISI